MRIVLVALGLVILLAVGWVLKGLTSDREERDFAVHYSWIVKWALTLAGETQRAPAGATFDSPRIEVAGHPNRWVVSGYLNWRDALGEPIGEPYTAVVENICKAYADPRCWQLENFAIGEPAIELAQTTLESAAAASVEPSGGSTTEPGQQLSPEVTSADPVLALLNDSPPTTAEGALPDAPPLPIAQGIAVPERKPAGPVGIADVEYLLAETIRLADADSLAAIEEASRPAAGEVDTMLALAEAGTVVTPSDSAADVEALAGERDIEAFPAETEESPLVEETLSALAEPALPAYSIGIEPTIDESASAPERVEPQFQPASPIPAAGALSPSTAPASQPAPDAALVVLIQDRLDRIGYDPGPIDGRFGARTRAALEGFERDAGLPVTGEPSQTVLAALEQLLAARSAAQPVPKPQIASLPQEDPDSAALPAPAGPSVPTVLTPAPAASSATPSRASTEPTNLFQPQPNRSAPIAVDESLIFLIQHRLRQAGFTPGQFDGHMSESTANAIRAYQSKKGLTVDGVPSRALLERLEADVLDDSRSQPLAPTPLGLIHCHAGIGAGCTASPA